MAFRVPSSAGYFGGERDRLSPPVSFSRQQMYSPGRSTSFHKWRLSRREPVRRPRWLYVNGGDSWPIAHEIQRNSWEFVELTRQLTKSAYWLWEQTHKIEGLVRQERSNYFWTRVQVKQHPTRQSGPGYRELETQIVVGSDGGNLLNENIWTREWPGSWDKKPWGNNNSIYARVRKI